MAIRNDLDTEAPELALMNHINQTTIALEYQEGDKLRHTAEVMYKRIRTIEDHYQETAKAVDDRVSGLIQKLRGLLLDADEKLATDVI